MGNSFGQREVQQKKRNSFEEIDDNVFTKKESILIHERYELLIKSDSGFPIADRWKLRLSEKGVSHTYEAFETFLADTLRSNSSSAVGALWKLTIDSDSFSDKVIDFFELLLTALYYERDKNDEYTPDQLRVVAARMCAAVCRSSQTQQGEPQPDLRNLDSWINAFGSCTASVIQTYLTELFLKTNIPDPSFFPFRAPRFVGNESSILRNGSIDLLPLALFSGSLQGEWTRLYSSSSDGLSFNRVVHHVLGYDGPTCILIKAQGSDDVFGAFSAERWKELNRFYGSAGSLLFTIYPEIRIMRSRGHSNGNFQWLNTKSYGLPHGLGVGGTLEGFRLFITDSFEQCMAAESCLTFETGKLISTGATASVEQIPGMPGRVRFEIDTLEVWACGGEEVISKGMDYMKKDREIREENIQKARKVDKAQFFNNSFDREFLLSNTFAHKQQQRDDGDC